MSPPDGLPPQCIAWATNCSNHGSEQPKQQRPMGAENAGGDQVQAAPPPACPAPRSTAPHRERWRRRRRRGTAWTCRGPLAAARWPWPPSTPQVPGSAAGSRGRDGWGGAGAPEPVGRTAGRGGGSLPRACGVWGGGRAWGAAVRAAVAECRPFAVSCLPALRRRCVGALKWLSGPGLAAEGRVLRALLYVFHSRLLRHRSYLAMQQVSGEQLGRFVHAVHRSWIGLGTSCKAQLYFSWHVLKQHRCLVQLGGERFTCGRTTAGRPAGQCLS